LKKKLGITSMFLAALLVLTLAPGTVVAEDVAEEIIFLHTNDEHGVIENFDRIAWYNQQLQEEYENVFLVSGGDIFSGNPVVDEYVIEEENLRGKPIVGLMNMAGYDALVLGNHEFDYGQEVLQDRIDQAEFPAILANFDTSETDILAQPEPYIFLETEQGNSIAVLGLVEVGADGIPATHPGNLDGIEFFDPVETALEYDYLADESSVFLGLTHMGHSWDQDLAEEMPELDLIIGGHSHSVVEDPPIVNDVLVAQAGADTNYLGKIEVGLDDEGNIVSREGRLIDIEDIEDRDEEVTAEIEYYEEQVEEIFAREIGYVEGQLSGNMELGSLMTDAARHRVDADFAFQNNGGIRVSEIGGEITVGTIFELEPFGNDVVVYEMTAEDIRSLLQFSYERRYSIDLQAGGLHYEVKVNDIGAVEDIELSYPDGTPLNEDEVYEVALSDYVASTYEFSARDEGVNTYRRTNDVIIEYIEEDLEPGDLEDYKGVDRISTSSVPGGEGTEISRTQVPLSTVGKEDGSVTAGNLKADAVRSVLDVDFGTYPSDQLADGAEFEDGPVYEEALQNVLYDSFAYDNNVVIATVTGEMFEEMLQNQNEWYDGAATQASGFTYEIIKEDGEIAATEVYVDGERIDPEAEYTAAFNSHVFQFYSEDVSPLDTSTTDRIEVEILMEYVEDIEEFGEELADERINIIER